MDRNAAGMLAESKSGHDKGRIYVIIKEDEQYVYLSDGSIKPFENCKKKNRKHIQIICRPVQELRERLLKGEAVRNEEIKRAIKLFQKDM